MKLGLGSSLQHNWETNGKGDFRTPPTAGQGDRLQGQDRSAVTHTSSSHARPCVFTTALARNNSVHDFTMTAHQVSTSTSPTTRRMSSFKSLMFRGLLAYINDQITPKMNVTRCQVI
ncbi:hypothetical protein J6590_044062 [Homalodisca vitripennis]|nr:hypothetical protein J6590_044062 [Homalodisca vitripennis]